MLTIPLLWALVGLGITLGVYLGFLLGLGFAGDKLAEQRERIAKQEEYWECLQCQMAELDRSAKRQDAADWWLRDEEGNEDDMLGV
jgi:hypothetical protein